MLRYVEVDSALRGGVLVLKMRASAHEQQIRELIIGSGELTVGEPFRGLGGILSGQVLPRP